MIEGYMKFYSTGVLANVGAVNPCVKSKTNHLHANTGVRKSISDSRTLHWLTQVATIPILTSASPRPILVFSGRYHIISNASLVNNCIITFHDKRRTNELV